MAEPLLYKSLFTIYSGFIVFLATIINRTLNFLEILDQYFVIFFFSGVLISITGIVMMFMWNFNNREPYYENKEENKKHFAPYLTLGSIFVLTGFTYIFYIRDITQTTFIIATGASMIGILLSLKGLRFFVKEVYSVRKKIPQHS